MSKKLNKITRSISGMLAAGTLVAGIGVSTQALASEPFIAEIKMFGGNFNPRGYAFCNGQILPINQNTALFSLLGTTYGGDGRTTFALPDMRGRSPVHSGNSTGPGLTNVRLGERGGTEFTTLGVANLPSHSHSASASTITTTTIDAYSGRGNTDTPAAAAVLAKKPRTNIYYDGSETPDVTIGGASSSSSTSVTVNSTGSGLPINNRDPYIGINFIIALTGIFPSRN